MSDVQRKRHEQLKELLLSNAEGFTPTQLAEVLGVTRQTIHLDLNRLSSEGISITDTNGVYTLNKRDYLRPLNLSLAQAWFLYLPLRRIVRAELHRYPLVRSLLNRIAALLHEEIADQLVPEESETQQEDRIFLDLVTAWQEKQLVELRYRRPNATEETRMLLAPWWFEPAVWSDAFYVIGGLVRTDGAEQPIVLKLDRIQKVTPRSTQFERPSAEAILQWVSKSWGIWTGEGHQVTLRFANRQLDRLRETRWHPLQTISIAPDGSVLWQAVVDEPQEMLPWIRGWGADVEVLEPQHIRELVAVEALRTARLYGNEGENSTGHYSKYF